MREDILRVYPALDPSLVHVIRNGIDTDVWYPAGPMQTGSVLAELGVDPHRPTVAFVGRITRQKGVAHLVAAAHQFDPEVQLVLCAGAPDTPEIADEIRSAVAAAGPQSAGRVLDPRDAAHRRDYAKYYRRQRFSCAPRSTSRWAS